MFFIQMRRAKKKWCGSIATRSFLADANRAVSVARGAPMEAGEARGAQHLNKKHAHRLGNYF